MDEHAYDIDARDIRAVHFKPERSARALLSAAQRRFTRDHGVLLFYRAPLLAATQQLMYEPLEKIEDERLVRCSTMHD